MNKLKARILTGIAGVLRRWLQRLETWRIRELGESAPTGKVAPAPRGPGTPSGPLASTEGQPAAQVAPNQAPPLPDFACWARRETLALMRDCLHQAVVESAVAEKGGTVSPKQGQEIERAAAEIMEQMPWEQFGTRLFEQGGEVHQDRQRRVIRVTLKPFPNPLLQRACELLCEHLDQHPAVMPCPDGEYTLCGACETW